jgi:hypothetical protein
VTQPEEWVRPVAALGAEVERVRVRVDQHDTNIKAAQTSADAARRAVASLVQQITALAEAGKSRGGQEDEDAAAVVSWLTVDEDQAADVLAGLVEWLDTVYLQYPDAILPDCWLWHPDAIEELLALQCAWLAAYTGKDASAARAIDWHDRGRPGVLRRLARRHEQCSVDAHKPGSRAGRVQWRRVPATSAVSTMADWWGSTHGTAAAPMPTREVLAESAARMPTF